MGISKEMPPLEPELEIQGNNFYNNESFNEDDEF